MREMGGGRRVENTSHVRDLNHFLHELSARQRTHGGLAEGDQATRAQLGSGAQF